jgi:hypothetical protein
MTLELVRLLHVSEEQLLVREAGRWSGKRLRSSLLFSSCPELRRLESRLAAAQVVKRMGGDVVKW